MGAILITFFFIFFCFMEFSESSTGCVRIRCSKKDPVISFPFRIKGRQGEPCGYPGFDLTCDKNKTVLELPFTSPFYVQHINYGSKSNEIQLRDPDNCIFRRLLDDQLNLSSSPFIGIRYKKYSFYNCSSDRSFKSNMLSTPMISCLSSSAHAVFATSAISPDSLLLSQNCALIANIEVPVETSTGLADLLHLTWEWSTSDCKSCKNPKAPSKKHGLGGLTYLIIVVSIIAVLCIARVCTLSSFRGNHPPEAEALPHQSVIVNTGLNESMIESFPTIVLGESRRLPKGTDTACSICIEEYQSNETLRSLPACNHFFHAHCIDVWLLIDSRCPVCNKKSSVASETTP